MPAVFANPCPALDPLILSFRARSLDVMLLRNPWSDLHGGFGLMLHAHWPSLYQDLYGKHDDSQDVRPYILRPLYSSCGPWQPGQEFAFELVLIGPAARHAAACCEALAQLGVNGVTRERFRFAIESIESRNAAGNVQVWSPGAGWNVRALLPTSLADLCRQPRPGNLFVMRSPLRLKADNDILRQAPDTGLLAARMLGRLKMLAELAGDVPPLPPQTARLLRDEAGALPPGRTQVSWMPLKRYAGGKVMDHGGLIGWLILPAMSPELTTLFGLAEWLHLGSKTSFGLGWAVLETAR